MISEDFINELKNRCDIEYIISLYVNLKQAGKNKVGICPFHSEKTPSMVVYNNTQSFYCFGCGIGGDVITFIKNIEHLDYPEAVNFLAKKVGLNIPQNIQDNKTYVLKKKVLEINKIAAKHFFKNLINPKFKEIKQYLYYRQLTPTYVKKFGLGYAINSWDDIIILLKSKGFSEKEILASNLASKSKTGIIHDVFKNRLIFPIIDLTGNVIAFGGRILDNNSLGPKYLNSSDTIIFKKSNNLYGLNFCKNTKKSYIILTEGYMDVIALYKAGFDNTVATLGTALTSQQARLISSYTSEVVISYDSDGAGKKASSKTANILSDTGITVKILDIEGAKDPDEYIKKFGREKFSVLIKNCKNILDFKINELKNKYDLSDSQNKVNFLKEIVSTLSEISNPLEREVYTSKISEELNINRDVLNVQVNKNIKKLIAQNKKAHTKILNTVGYQLKQTNNNNIKITIAENKIITILLKNPDFYKIVNLKLDSKTFNDPINKNIFEVISRRLKNNLPIDITNLSNFLDEQSINKIAYLLASDLNLNFNEQDLNDYINVLLNNKNNFNFSQMDNNQLKNYFSNIKKNKS